MKDNFIRVLKVEPRKEPEVVELKNELHALQDAVSIGAPDRGLIETVNLEPDVLILLNEEGKLLHLQLNRVLAINGAPVDALHGVFYVVGCKDGDFTSLTEANIEKYKKFCSGLWLNFWD